jgi:hypothetical protein
VATGESEFVSGNEIELWRELKAAKCSLDWMPAVHRELANWKDKVI